MPLYVMQPTNEDHNRKMVYSLSVILGGGEHVMVYLYPYISFTYIVHDVVNVTYNAFFPK